MITRIALQIVRGFCMGAADVVPGVSGGTVALVFGIYRKLVETIQAGAHALGHLARLDLRGALQRLRAIDGAFLLPLLAGIVLAVLTLAHTIERLLDEQPVRLAGAFFGLIIGSIVVTWRLVKRWDGTRGAVLVATAAVTFLVLGLRSGPLADPALGLVFLAGAIAICAMILPGVSGSFLLVMIGMYDAVLGAVNARDLDVIAIFAVGAVLGLALFSSALGWLLGRHEPTVMAALIGLMIGSLRVLWPWPEGTAGTTLAAPAQDVLAPVLLAIASAAIVVAISLVARAREHPPRITSASPTSGSRT